MRRTLTLLALFGFLGLVLLCGAGLAVAWQNQGRDLVPPNAGGVRISSQGAARLHISYRIAPGQTVSGVRRRLMLQGWRAVRTPNVDRSSMTLVRSSMFNIVREVVVIDTHPNDRRSVDVYFARCLRVGSWVSCP